MTPAACAQKIKRALQHPLPGETAQARMAPDGRKPGDRRFLIKPDHREGAVMVLLYPTNGNLNLVLIRRQEYNGVHSGQIALPGGAREPGESYKTTALREVFEEVGVPSTQIKILGALSPLYIPPSNFMVYPFVGYYPARPKFIPNQREVAEIIEVPLTTLFDESITASETRVHNVLGEVEIPYYFIQRHKVWGATAMIISEFVDVLQKS